MFFLCGLLAMGVTAPPVLFAGPAKVGDSVTYRVSKTMAATQAPDVSTIVITWRGPAKLYARLAGGSAAALTVTRTADGQLSLAAPNPADPSAAVIAMLLDQLNFPGRVAASLGGADHAQMSMSITPPTPSSSASPAPARSPLPLLPVDVPLDINLLRNTSGVTLIADGNSNQRGSPSGGDRGGRGGGMGGSHQGGSMSGSMGGWHSSRSGRGQQQSNENTPSIDIAIQANYDLSGVLQHAMYRESFTTRSSGAPTIEHTITIDRTN